jgi:hypothetical protein
MLDQRVRFIVHKNKTILMIDFSGAKSSEVLETIPKAKDLIVLQPENSLYTLTIFTGTSFNTEVLQAMKGLIDSDKKYVKAAAVVGITGMAKWAFDMVTRLSGRNFIVCANVEDAKNILASL